MAHNRRICVNAPPPGCKEAMPKPDLGSIMLFQDAVGCTGQSRHADRGAVHDGPNTPMYDGCVVRFSKSFPSLVAIHRFARQFSLPMFPGCCW